MSRERKSRQRKNRDIGNRDSGLEQASHRVSRSASSQRPIFADFRKSTVFRRFSEIDFWRSVCHYPSYFERFGRHFTVFSALLHSFTVSQFHRTGRGGWGTNCDGNRESQQGNRKARNGKTVRRGSWPVAGASSHGYVIADHGLIMRKRGEIIGKLGERIFKSVFSGLW